MSLSSDRTEVVRNALREDVGSGDITAFLIDASRKASATVIAREEAIICGVAWFNEAFHQLDPDIHISWNCSDGDRVQANHTLCDIQGNARTMLTAERTALNFLQFMSAVSSRTARYVSLIKDYPTKILDTRKTIPCLRSAQKYAVACGGGHNHRLGLYDAILIKENHIAAAGSIDQAVKRARLQYPDKFIEIEVENLQDLTSALAQPIDRILLDNLSINDLHKAVALNSSRVELEASGGICLDTIRSIAETGVDYISIGELTKSVQAVDLSMRFK